MRRRARPESPLAERTSPHKANDAIAIPPPPLPDYLGGSMGANSDRLWISMGLRALLRACIRRGLGARLFSATHSAQAHLLLLCIWNDFQVAGEGRFWGCCRVVLTSQLEVHIRGPSVTLSPPTLFDARLYGAPVQLVTLVVPISLVAQRCLLVLPSACIQCSWVAHGGKRP